MNKTLDQLENGYYLKAKICGVNQRTVISKNDGAEYIFYSLVVETSLTAQKQYIEMGKKLIEKGIVSTLKDAKYSGKTVFIPVYFVNKDGYFSIHYAGEFLPIFLQEHSPNNS